VVLSRDLANAGRFPAIDVLASLSRLFSSLASPSHKAAAVQVRRWMQRYRDVEDLLKIGAYVSGTDAETDVAVAMNPGIQSFLQQDTYEPCELTDILQQLCDLSGVSV
jgi:flagellum-specific ATP synthase